MKEYDLAVIGGGISGLMAAYKLLQNKPNSRIIVFDKGKNVTDRHCPIIERQSDKCLDCNPCSTTCGVAGAGAFSDGKFIITNEYGGWLSDYISPEDAIKYMELADSILVSFGASEFRYKPNNQLKKLCLQNGLYMKQGEVKHFGTENNIRIMRNFVEALSKSCEIMSECEVLNVKKEEHVVLLRNSESIFAECIIFSVGRSGNSFLKNWCLDNGVEINNNNVDIGVRVELPSSIWEDISQKVYDPKISYRSKKYGDETRMFCFNEGGQVVTENTDGIKTVNGHAYADPKLKSKNSNFALLSTIKFSEPFEKPIEYIKSIAGIANYISNGTVIVQRFGDLISGHRTTQENLRNTTVRPTLNAYPGDLSLCIPKRQLDNIIETVEKLDAIAPGTANYDTLLYGVECKYYSARPRVNNFELDGCTKIYACGDGAGFTRSLAQAAANGLYISDKIL